VPKPDPGSHAARAKPGAPVEIRSSVAGERVRLEVRFGSAAQDVQVGLLGTGGLRVVEEPEPVPGRSMSAGETLVLEVGVAPGPGHSNLGILVGGSFGGAWRSRSASVSFGPLERDELRALSRADDGRGRPLKIGRGRIR
jgi:hypothetical protein